jgi:hypothetical protein
MVRCLDREPIAADLAATIDLARLLDRFSDGALTALVEDASSAAESVSRVRRDRRAALAKGPMLLAGGLRTKFESTICEERAFFGLPALH